MLTERQEIHKREILGNVEQDIATLFANRHRFGNAFKRLRDTVAVARRLRSQLRYESVSGHAA